MLVGKFYCAVMETASDSQHTTEFVNRFKINRSPLPAISLTTDTSNITSIANDLVSVYFSKQIQAIANEQDVLIAISTSGKNENVIEALKVVENILTLSMTGKNINNVEQYSDLNVSIPSDERGIQQAHITILQIIAGLIEQWHAKRLKSYNLQIMIINNLVELEKIIIELKENNSNRMYNWKF